MLALLLCLAAEQRLLVEDALVAGSPVGVIGLQRESCLDRKRNISGHKKPTENLSFYVKYTLHNDKYVIH